MEMTQYKTSLKHAVNLRYRCIFTVDDLIRRRFNFQTFHDQSQFEKLLELALIGIRTSSFTRKIKN